MLGADKIRGQNTESALEKEEKKKIWRKIEKPWKRRETKGRSVERLDGS